MRVEPRDPAGRLLAGRPDRTSYDTHWLLRALHAAESLFAPVADPTQAGNALSSRLGRGVALHYGYVVDYVAYTRCYRVFFSGVRAIIPCTPLISGSSAPWGARSLGTIPPGCGVLVAVGPGQPYGMILGVEPRIRIDAVDSRGDWLAQAGRCGIRVDGMHRQVFQCAAKGGVIDWSTNRPMDGLSGEEGWIAETGLRVALDPFLVQLAVNESCGVFGFYHDDLLRLAAYNFHHFTCGNEREVLDDQGEVRWVEGYATYPWEQLGALKPGVDPFVDNDPAAVQVDRPFYSYVEPQHDDQQPFHRARVFRGYLGQAGKELTVVPPAPDDDLLTYEDREGGQAVFEEFRSLTGRYAVRSAKGIHLVKYHAIPNPKAIRRPEHKEGDNPKDYKASGAWGEGDAHKVVGEPETTGATPHVQQAAGIMDLHAWAFNWEACHPFHYHRSDWALPEESETDLARATPAPIPFASLAGRFYLPRPEALYLDVDHRYGPVAYYPNAASLDLNDDGGVVLGDGYGAEIRMVGGHITLSCPGDVWLLPGRNVVGWAGRDVCIRAKNSLDLSATDRDVRVKAEHNLHMLAGNDGKAGGILLESKAPSAYVYDAVVGEDVVSGGVQVKASRGSFTAWARDVYLRTGGGDIGPGGQITLDANKGTAAIVTHSQSFLRYVQETCTDYFTANETVVNSNSFGPEGAAIGTPLSVDGTGVFLGTVLVHGWLMAVGGHVATELADNPEWVYVAPLNKKPLVEAIKILEDVAESIATIVQAGENYYLQGFTNYWYVAAGAGDDATIAAVHFTFRSDEQYRTADFAFHEARWQQLSRLAGTVPATWSENPVTIGSLETWPYPGRDAWSADAKLYEQDLALYDADTGCAQDRADARSDYERPRYREPADPKKLDGNYTIIG